MSALKIIKFILFSNTFYGICAVALSIETAYQQSIPLANLEFYIFIFLATVIYYTYAYMQESGEISVGINERQYWYNKYQKIFPYSQTILLFTATILIYNMIGSLKENISTFSIIHWFVLLSMATIAILYYGLKIPGKKLLNLRSVGFIKPFLIAFIWASTVSLGPILYYDFLFGTNLLLSTTTLFLFTKNGLFILVLCILFDIKDYATDYNLQLKTIVVRFGLRKTLFNVIFPLALLSWLFFVVLAIIGQFAFIRILMNTIPFIMLIIVCYSMYQRKSILYYLAIIDGLMLVKAICGITGMIFIK